MKHIYIVFSSTPFRMGKLVRQFTGDKYNHISVSLDLELTKMYSFARRYYRMPFYGGFVRENVSRYNLDGMTTQVCICGIPVTNAQFASLSKQLAYMEENKEHYLYNHLSAVAAVFRTSAKREDAYTSVEFCTDVLRQIGISLDSKHYYTIGQLHNILEPNIIYSGPLEPAKTLDIEFFADEPMEHPSTATIRSIGKLLQRKRYK